ncbi:MAG TPA: hypothetical protein ENN87_03670, partial [Phycisphaerales bacterium]|nr:hypothetical protein [Phycisphaerales bacterium]
MRHAIMALLMTGWALAVCAAGTGPSEVAEVIRGSSATDFLVRVTDWPEVGAVRAYVRIRGIEARQGVDSFQAAQDLGRRLKEAKRIRLLNVEQRSYFRLVADVEIDGKDLASQLAAGPYAERAEPVSSVPADQSKEGPPTAMARSVVLRQPILSEPQAKAATASLSELLDTRLDLSAWTPETTLGEALDMLQSRTNPPLPLVILWRDLRENALVDRNTPIGLAGTGMVPMRQALRLVLLSAGGGPGRIGCYIRDGVITVATPASGLNREYATRAYDTRMLTMPPANPLQGMGYGQMGTGLGMGGL